MLLPLIPAVAVDVHVKVVPITLDEIVTVLYVSPLQKVCEEGRIILGIGFIVIVSLIGGPLQPFAVGVIK